MKGRSLPERPDTHEGRPYIETDPVKIKKCREAGCRENPTPRRAPSPRRGDRSLYDNLPPRCPVLYTKQIRCHRGTALLHPHLVVAVVWNCLEKKELIAHRWLGFVSRASHGKDERRAPSADIANLMYDLSEEACGKTLFQQTGNRADQRSLATPCPRI